MQYSTSSGGQSQKDYNEYRDEQLKKAPTFAFQVKKLYLSENLLTIYLIDNQVVK